MALRRMTMLMMMTMMMPGPSESARILCVSHQFGSHLSMLHAVAEGLITNGHEVYTIYSNLLSVPSDVQDRGFKVLRYHTPSPDRLMGAEKSAQDIIDHLFYDAPLDFDSESKIAGAECIDMELDENLMRQIGDLNFDLALVDSFPLAACLFFVPLRFHLPFVTVLGSLEMEQMRVPALPSFVPTLFYEFSDNMSFVERLQNFLGTVMINVPALSPFTAVKNTTLLEKYRTQPDMTSWFDYCKEASLYLIHRGHILEYPAPLVPHVINIECLTCKPGKELSADIKTLVDSATDGFVVVSFGSGIDNFPDHVARKFLDAFSQRKELFFWRFRGDLPGVVPGNVKTMKWLPQNDLLAHPRAKLFITHSGNNGQYESLYHGVPMLAFPLFAEQPHNAARIVIRGYGLRSDIKSFTVSELLQKMTRLIEEPIFTERTRKASRILKSAPMTAQETAVHWVEHVLEFGADHLRSNAIRMPWYAFYMADIFVCLLIFSSIAVCAISGSFYLLCRYLVSKARKTKVE